MNITLSHLIENNRKRAEMGKENYGTYLTAENGRNPLVDAYQDCFDTVVYLRQAIEDMDSMPPIRENYAFTSEPAPISQPDKTPIFKLVEQDIVDLDGGYYSEKAFTNRLYYTYYQALQVLIGIQKMIDVAIAAQESGEKEEFLS